MPALLPPGRGILSPLTRHGTLHFQVLVLCVSALCGRNYHFEVIHVFCFLKLTGRFCDIRSNP